MSENLRREPRIDARIQVVVVRGRRTIPVETSDVSFKGLRIQTAEPPALRSLLRLRVSLPSREIEAHAMTVHSATHGVGVQFWGLAGPDRTAWDDFVRELIQTQIAAKKKAAAQATEAEEAAPSGVRLAFERETLALAASSKA